MVEFSLEITIYGEYQQAITLAKSASHPVLPRQGEEWIVSPFSYKAKVQKVGHIESRGLPYLTLSPVQATEDNYPFEVNKFKDAGWEVV